MPKHFRCFSFSFGLLSSKMEVGVTPQLATAMPTVPSGCPARDHSWRGQAPDQNNLTRSRPMKSIQTTVLELHLAILSRAEA